MKLAIMCQSLLLENALKLFLEPYIVPFKQSDFIVCDCEVVTEKPQFRLKSHNSMVPFPFSKSALLLSLEKFSKTIEPSVDHEVQIESTIKKDLLEVSPNSSSDFAVLEKKLGEICEQFNAQIIKAVKEHYDK